MSLGHLLATGKSVMGMKDRNSPYRLATQNLLPKFGSDKNPFAAPAAPPVPAAPVVPKETNPPALELTTPSLFEIQPVPAAPGGSPGASGSEAPASLEQGLESVNDAGKVSTSGRAGEAAPAVSGGPNQAGEAETSFLVLARMRMVGVARHKVSLSPYHPEPADPQAPVVAKAAAPVVGTAPVESAPVLEPAKTRVPALERKAEPLPAVAGAGGNSRQKILARLGKLALSPFQLLLAGARRLSPRRWFARAKSTKPRGRFPIQPELLLDQVKVIRNDLSETDLEVVPGRPAPQRSGAGGERSAREAVTPRMLELGPTQPR